MQINKNWKITDEVSGLKIEILEGKALDRLHIENIDGTMNRDFWFAKNGDFDGTGSCIQHSIDE